MRENRQTEAYRLTHLIVIFYQLLLADQHLDALIQIDTRDQICQYTVQVINITRHGPGGNHGVNRVL